LLVNALGQAGFMVFEKSNVYELSGHQLTLASPKSRLESIITPKFPIISASVSTIAHQIHAKNAN
jgi:hypothetical protein